MKSLLALAITALVAVSLAMPVEAAKKCKDAKPIAARDP
jgi:hypothetical protein